ncbi:hypothetical protein MTO96_029546 [Rhipicephalus appendiculatus]
MAASARSKMGWNRAHCSSVTGPRLSSLSSVVISARNQALSGPRLSATSSCVPNVLASPWSSPTGAAGWEANGTSSDCSALCSTGSSGLSAAGLAYSSEELAFTSRRGLQNHEQRQRKEEALLDRQNAAAAAPPAGTVSPPTQPDRDVSLAGSSGTAPEASPGPTRQASPFKPPPRNPPSQVAPPTHAQGGGDLLMGRLGPATLTPPAPDTAVEPPFTGGPTHPLPSGDESLADEPADQATTETSGPADQAAIALGAADFYSNIIDNTTS